MAAALAQARRDLADLTAEHAALADTDVVDLDDEHDAEGSTVGYERARIAGLIERTERRITELEAAAVRIAAGTFDVCEVCGGPIGAERLAALATTRRCVACASPAHAGVGHRQAGRW